MPLPEVKLLHLRRCRKTSSRFLQRRTKRLGIGGQKCWLKGGCWDELWFVEVFLQLRKGSRLSRLYPC